MTIKELKDKNSTELTRLLATEREKLRDLRFKVAQGQLKDVREVREARYTVARIMTLLKSTPAKKSS